MDEKQPKATSKVKDFAAHIGGYVIGFIIVSIVIAVFNYMGTTKETGLSSDYKKNFMQACTGNGGPYSYCNCAISYLENNYSPKYLYSIENDATAQADVTGKAVSYCTQ